MVPIKVSNFQPAQAHGIELHYKWENKDSDQITEYRNSIVDGTESGRHSVPGREYELASLLVCTFNWLKNVMSASTCSKVNDGKQIWEQSGSLVCEMSYDTLATQSLFRIQGALKAFDRLGGTASRRRLCVHIILCWKGTS